jgi:hypothetical protein
MKQTPYNEAKVGMKRKTSETLVDLEEHINQ